MIAKDLQIHELCKDIHLLIEKSDIQSQKLDVLSKLLYKESDDKVLDEKSTQKKQELVVLQRKDDPNNCVVLQEQKAHLNQQLKRTQDQMHVVGTAE